MELNKIFVADIETIGYLDELKSFEDFHVLGCSYLSNEKWKIKTTTKREDVIKIIGNPENTIVFHNGMCYDKPALEKMGISFKANIIDTLALSYYLYPERDKHGLAYWGEFFGVPKPEIDDWKGLTIAEYTNRVKEDVKINTNLWVMMLRYLRALYDSDKEIISVIKYLNHKMDMIYLQDKNKLTIDLKLASKNLEYLKAIIEEKKQELKKIMPKVAVKTIKKRPSKQHKVDGTLTAMWIKWELLLKENKLPVTHEEDVEYIRSYREPNPGSSQQMKDFLFLKGWQPKIYKDGANGKVPQLRDDDKNLCPSIQNLCKKYPELESLDGLSVAQHRAGYLKAFLEKTNEGGKLAAWAHGFTKTLRLKHANPCVNLPKPSATYGELVRGIIVAPKGHICIGADLSSIEDKCKQISINSYDPEYVKKMNIVGWDAHLDLGNKAGFFSLEEVDFYKWFKSREKETIIGCCPKEFIDLTLEEQELLYENLDVKRAISKTGTYSLTYGCGVSKLMEATGLSKKEATKLHKGYWDINKSVKAFAKDRIVKTVEGTNWLRKSKKVGGLTQVNNTKWVWNEYSNMWLFLKNEKDIFSACNQNFGVKVFDIWGYYLKLEGIEPSFQAHDEYLIISTLEDKDKYLEAIKRSVIKLNSYFKPPIPIEIDYKIGKNYAKVH